MFPSPNNDVEVSISKKNNIFFNTSNIWQNWSRLFSVQRVFNYLGLHHHQNVFRNLPKSMVSVKNSFIQRTCQFANQLTFSQVVKILRKEVELFRNPVFFKSLQYRNQFFVQVSSDKKCLLLQSSISSYFCISRNDIELIQIS